MKKNFFRLLLLTALMLTGGNVWAAMQYSIVYGTAILDDSGTTIVDVSPQTDFTNDDGNTASDVISEDANGINCTNAMPIGGSVLHSSVSFSKSFESPATKGTVHFEANYTSTTNGQETWKIVDSNGVEIFGSTDCGNNNGNGTCNWGFCNGVSLGTNWFRQARKAHNRIVLDINLTTKVVSYTVLVSSGNNSYTTLTGNYNLPEGVSDVKGLTATKSNYYSYMDNVSLYNVYDDAVDQYAYTINYQLSDKTVVVSESDAAEAGTTITALSSVWNSDKTQKYFVEENATTQFEVSDSEEDNIFVVDVREAEKWNYSVNAVVGTDVLTTIFTGTVVEGEIASYGYPQYVAKDGNLYISTKQNSNPWWGKSFTPASNNESQSIAYTDAGISGIVFCEEAENIESLTKVVGGNTDIRASNRGGAFASAEGSVITTLPAGTYVISSALYGNVGTEITFKAGDDVVLSITTSGNPIHTNSDMFTLSDETDIIVVGGNGGNSPKIVDYIFIRQIPTETITVTSAGARTYCSENVLDFSNVEGLKAYYLTVDGDQISMGDASLVGGYVGVYIEAAEGSYEVPVLNDLAVERLPDGVNDLVGVAEETQVEAPIYVLMNADNRLGFYKTSKTFTVGAHTAYIPGDKVNADVKSLTFMNNEPTGISDVNADSQSVKNAVIYNLAGQRVAAPAKGIYIVNGKKVLFK